MRGLVTLALALSLGGAALWVAPAGAQGDVAAFCQARLDVNGPVFEEGRKGTQPALDALAASAPAEVQTRAGRLAVLFEGSGARAFETKQGAKAARAIDEFVADSCGFPVTGVGAIDYEFTDVPDSLVAGRSRPLRADGSALAGPRPRLRTIAKRSPR
jgi:hypothetical protein